jgi:predicted ATP-binding protein involved in virulence
MSPATVLRVDRLELRNFRCFAECKIELHPQLTVLVAENGRGKTALLDAVGIALGTFVDALTGSVHFHKFARSDVRLIQGEKGAMQGVVPTEFVADGYVSGQQIRWSCALAGDSRRSRTTRKDAELFSKAAKEFLGSNEHDVVKRHEDQTVLPLVAFYGTGRLWSEHRLTEGKRTTAVAAAGRTVGYTDCLSSSSSFKGMVAWYENKWNETHDPRYSTELSKTLPLLTAVQKATRVVLEPTGWCELDWDLEKKSLVVGHHDYGRLPLSALSDGVRNMIALIADIARRCATLNPQLSEDAARLTPGVLLIDEVDMHLHPRWQQLIVELLRKAFPSLQMILTTHSPHVLSTVDADSIRVIRLSEGRGILEIPAFQTRGVESADILAKVMDVDPVPQVEQARWLTDYRTFVQTGENESPGARDLWDRLVTHFGKEHPVLAEVETLRRLQEFKRTNKLPLQGNS